MAIARSQGAKFAEAVDGHRSGQEAAENRHNLALDTVRPATLGIFWRIPGPQGHADDSAFGYENGKVARSSKRMLHTPAPTLHKSLVHGA